MVLTTLLCLGLGLAFLLVQKPYYRSSVELLLDFSAGPTVGNAATVSSQVSTQQSVGSQIFVVQSREVLRQVVKDLDLTSDAYLAASGGWRQRIFGASTGAAGDATDRVVEALRKNLTVGQAGDSLVLTIDVTHRDREMAARIANAVADAYLKVTDQSQTVTDQRASTALQEQTEALRHRLLDALAVAEKFRTEHGLITTGAQGLVTDQQLAAVNQQLLAARQVAEQQKTISDQANQLNVSNVETGAIAEALQSATLIDLRSRYAQLLDRQAELATNLGAEHPQMRAVRSQAASMRTAIENELQRIRKSAANNYERARANVAALQTRFDALTGSNGDEGDARIKLAQLESEAASINAVYQSFLTRSEEFGRQQDIGTGKSRVISPAVPSNSPVQAPKILVLVASVLFGAIAGSMLAVLREGLSDTVRSERELVARTGAPILTTIELAPDAAEPGWLRSSLRKLPFARGLLSLMEGPRGGAREQSLARAAHLLRAGRDQDTPTTVAVLSADPAHFGEAAAAGIARHLHDLGEKVFLCDGSLRSDSGPHGSGGRAMETRDDVVVPLPQGDRFQHPLQDILYFRRVGEEPRAASSLLSLAPGGARTRDERAPFFIIDTCGTEAQNLLPLILKYTDGILALSQLGATHRDALATLVTSIGPWREKLIGNILVEKKAA